MQMLVGSLLQQVWNHNHKTWDKNGWCSLVYELHVRWVWLAKSCFDSFCFQIMLAPLNLIIQGTIYLFSCV